VENFINRQQKTRKRGCDPRPRLRKHQRWRKGRFETASSPLHPVSTCSGWRGGLLLIERRSEPRFPKTTKEKRFPCCLMRLLATALTP